MPTEEKRQAVAELRAAIEQCTGFYVTEFSGIRVNNMNALRGTIADADANLVVVKNSLFRLAVADTPAAGISDLMIGPRAVLFCYGDPVAPAKTIKEFGDKNNDAITIKGGFGEGRVLDEAQANRMATLPSRDELIASVVGGIAAPVTGLVFALNGIVSEFVYTLQAVADQKQSA